MSFLSTQLLIDKIEISSKDLNYGWFCCSLRIKKNIPLKSENGSPHDIILSNLWNIEKILILSAYLTLT